MRGLLEVAGTWKPSRPSSETLSASLGSRSMCPGTHCSTALARTTSTGSSGRQVRTSPSSKSSCPGTACAAAASIMAGEESTPVIRASGHQSASSAVALPGPQPRSTTLATRRSSVSMCETRSRNGRSRSASNLRYCWAFQISLAMRIPVSRLLTSRDLTVLPVKNLDVKMLGADIPATLALPAVGILRAGDVSGAQIARRRSRMHDEVDRLVEAWHRERPDLDVAPLEVLSRVRDWRATSTGPAAPPSPSTGWSRGSSTCSRRCAGEASPTG